MNQSAKKMKPKKKQGISKLMQLCCILLWMGFLCCCPLAASAAGNLQRSSFPKESLLQRLSRIEQQQKVRIAFDKAMVEGITVNPLHTDANKTEELLAKSLQTTGLAYTKYSNASYAIVRSRAEEVAPQQTAGNRGTIRGTVVDKDGNPVVGAAVKVLGTQMGAVTDLRGKFELKNVPTRSLTIEISCLSYRTMRINEVKVTPGKVMPLDVSLQESSEQLGEVVVTATYKKASAGALLAAQKNRTSVTDGLSADLIKKTSDNNLAQVIRRLPGISVNDGKFITVRGLSERYNNVTVNGASMPSTEPNRKNFNFQLIPTSLVENVVVVKSFMPDMSAEFAGGGMEINTLSTPDEPFLNVSLGTGFNTKTLGKDFWSGKRFKSDYLLGNSSTRYWMGRDWKMGEYKGLFDGYNEYGEGFATPEKREKATIMNSHIPNHWALTRTDGAPLQAYSLSGGRTFKFGEHKLGLVFGANYRHEEKRETYGSDNYLDPDQVELQHTVAYPVFASSQYEFSTSIGAIANASWQWKGQRIDWKNLYTNRYVMQSTLEHSYEPSGNGNTYVDIINSPQRNWVRQTRLEGKHDIWNGISAQWYWDFSQVHQDRPDERQVRAQVKNGHNHEGYRSSLQYGYYANGVMPGAADHIYSYALKEWKRNAGASLKYDFKVLNNDQQVKVGYDYNNRDAAFMQYWINVGMSAPEADLPQGEKAFHSGMLLNDYYAPEWFAKGVLVMRPWGYNPDGDGYNGSLDIKSTYAMGTFKFWNNRIVLSGGVRNEKAKYNSIGQANAGKDTVTYDDSHWFPSLNLALNVTPDIVLRAGYNKTIARYDFREVFVVPYYDVAEKIVVLGNDSLKNTMVQNYDFRAEWYPAAGEVLSVAYFIKKFTDPIEQYVYPDATNLNFRMEPRNLKSADGKGFEVNFRKNLGFIAPGSTIMKDFWLSGNAMFMDMKVHYTNERDSVRTRPLQDLVPYTINASLSYEGDIFGGAINYGTTGRKLIRAGVEEAADQYEAPRHVLDLQLSARLLKKRMEIKFNVSDLLAQPFIHYKNMGFKDKNEWGPKDKWKPYTDDMAYNKGKDWLIERSRRGTNYSLSVSYKF